MTVGIKEIIFFILALIDLAIAYMWNDGSILIPVLCVIVFIGSLIWAGQFWNNVFPPGVPMVDAPVITRETPPIVLATFGWMLLIGLTAFLIVKCV